MAQFKNLIVTGNSRFIGTSTFNNIGGGTFTAPIYFTGSEALPSKTLSYVCGIDGFTDGGQMGWQATSGLSVGSAARWTTARNFYISDNDATNTGPAVSVTGAGNTTIKLPAAIKATLTGNVTGNLTGQASRALKIETYKDSTKAATYGNQWQVCAYWETSNGPIRLASDQSESSYNVAVDLADSATKATQDGSGNTITSYYCTLSTAQTVSGAKTFSGNNSFSGKNIFTAGNSYNTTDTQKFIVGNSSSAFVFGGDGLQCFSGTSSTTAKVMYAQYYGGGLQIGGGAQSDLTIKGHINPYDKNMYNLGTSSKYWYNVYSANFSGNNFYVIGDGGTAHMLYNGADECLEFIFS